MNNKHLNQHAHLLSLVFTYPNVLSIGTPKTINFPFVPNGKLTVLGVPLFEHIMISVMCLNFGTPKNNQFYI